MTENGRFPFYLVPFDGGSAFFYGYKSVCYNIKVSLSINTADTCKTGKFKVGFELFAGIGVIAEHVGTDVARTDTRLV